MDVVTAFNEIPIADHLGLELLEAADGRAVGRLEHTEAVTSNPETGVLHGAAHYALADTVGGAATISLTEEVTPTIDMRIDYLAPASSDLRCEAEVVRHGGSVAMVRADVEDERNVLVATAHGVYKTGGGRDGGAWGERYEKRGGQREGSGGD